ncbi:uncharacterized protein V1516DRAFT_677600 [Lipomyces oligophaga]|uniref:uncharacterized protein n=1 Tax=Lipomyces oligophaga TaxID=45792 RepID=UPI0034CD276B
MADSELLTLSAELDASALRESDQFTLVVSRKNQYRGDLAGEKCQQSSTSRRRQKAQRQKYRAQTPLTIDDYCTRLDKKVEAVKRHPIYIHLFSETAGILKESMQKLDSKISYIRCLALGRITESDNSLFQLALLKIMQEYWDLPSENISLYDPDFIAQDIDVFNKLGYRVGIWDQEEIFKQTDIPNPTAPVEALLKNMSLEECSPSSDRSRRAATLYYMPHAPISLMDKIIGLQGVQLVFANDVLGYKERLSCHIDLVYDNLRNCIHQCAGESWGWNRVKLNDELARNESWWTSVNDLAIHWHSP